MLADTLGSVGVIIAALVLQFTGFALIDPIFGVGIGLFVLPRTWRLGRKSLRILTQSAPAHVDVDGVRTALCGLDGVADIHDLHVWTLTSGMDVASAHLVVAGDVDGHDVLDDASRLLREDFGIDHATLQLEPGDHETCHDHTTTW